jgi:hypothetical protein
VANAIESTATAPRQVLDGALSWLSSHLDHFDPFEQGSLTGFCEIPLAELSILALCGLRSRTCPGDVRRFLDFIEEITHDPVYAERPFREPETLVSHLVAYAALESAGRGVALDRRAVARIVDASTLTAPVLAPHRTMELRHALDLGRVRHHLPSYRQLYLRSAAAHRSNPIFMSRPETYVVTHVIFYATDLGNYHARGITDYERQVLARRVAQLLGMCVCERNWDLTAELIYCTYLLRSEEASPLLAEAWRCLAAAQLSDGAVPGPRADGTTEPDADAVYHTTLVCALAALGKLKTQV